MIIYQTVRVSALTNVISFGPCGFVDLDWGVRIQFPFSDAMWTAGYHFNGSFSWTVGTVGIRPAQNTQFISPHPSQ